MRNVKIVTDETYLMIIVSDFFIFKFNLEYKRKLSVKNELKFTDRLVSKFFDVREKCQSYQNLKQ